MQDHGFNRASAGVVRVALVGVEMGRSGHFELGCRSPRRRRQTPGVDVVIDDLSQLLGSVVTSHFGEMMTTTKVTFRRQHKTPPSFRHSRADPCPFGQSQYRPPRRRVHARRARNDHRGVDATFHDYRKIKSRNVRAPRGRFRQIARRRCQALARQRRDHQCPLSCERSDPLTELAYDLIARAVTRGVD